MRKWWLQSFLMLFLVGILASCEPSELNIHEQIEQANHCENNADCVDVGGKCPFGCYIYVHADQVSQIKALVDEYNSDCVYSCLACERVACVSGRCEPLCENPLRQPSS